MSNPAEFIQECAVNPAFWHSWIGIGALSVICVCAICMIISPDTGDRIRDRIYYWLMFFTSGGALLHAINGTSPKGVMRAFIILVAVRFLANTVESFLAPRKGKAFCVWRKHR